jgi:hypothetical protein
MKKLFVAAGLIALLAGCGGDGTNVGTTSGSTTGSTTGSTAGGGGRVYPTFSLGSNALVQTVFLSGVDRVVPRGRGAGDQIAVIKNVRYQNDSFDVIPSAFQSNTGEVRVQLNGYTLNTKKFGVNFGVGQSSQGYVEYPFEIDQILELQSDNTTTLLTPSNQVAFQAPQPFDVRMRVFPGRVTSASIRLNDAMVSFNQLTGEVDFNSDLFVSENYSPISNGLSASFADYVAFDLSGLDTADRPEMTTTGDPADRVYYSGDGIAMSTGLNNGSLFELLDPVRIQSGKVTTGPILGGNGIAPITGSNLFLLEDEDPAATRLTSLVGTWKPSTTVVSTTNTEIGICFPNSNETDSVVDGDREDFVLYKVNGSGDITAFWQGQAFYNEDGTGTFRLYPVNTIDDAVVDDPVTGTLSNLVIANGHVRRGDWEIDGTAPGNWPFEDEGTFGVYRR